MVKNFERKFIMSRIMPVNRKCSVCGLESEQRVLASTNAFGSPDLDLRPPEMQRSTMPMWIQECPHCGYISESIDDETSINKEFLKSEEYSFCSKNNFMSKLAEKFYKYYMINLLDDNKEDAFYAILHAAWACDDANDYEKAVYCRKLAIVEIEKIIKNNDNETLKVQKADLLRRAGLFEKLIGEYSVLNFADETLQKIIMFQIRKAKDQNSDCYTVADAIK